MHENDTKVTSEFSVNIIFMRLHKSLFIKYEIYYKKKLFKVMYQILITNKLKIIGLTTYT